MPFRELYWNISAHWLIYPLFAPFAVVFVFGCFRVVRMVWAGQPEAGIPPALRMFREVLVQAILQPRLLRERLAGSVHAAISR